MPETPYQRILAGREALYFLHIPRTAGTSTTAMLDSHFARDAICPWQTTDKLREVPREQWLGYQFYRGHFGHDLCRHIGRRPLCMTMLRDPVDSAISAFFDARRLGALGPTTRLESFAVSDAGASMAHRFRQQLLPDARRRLRELPDDETVAMAIESLESFAFVGVTERFDTSMQVLAHTMGWQGPAALPRLNRSGAPTHDPNDRGRELVAERVAPERPIFARAMQLLTAQHDRMVGELLDRAHRDRLRQASRITELQLDLDGPIPGLGWHAHESLRTAEPMRWTGPGNEATLDLPLAQQHSLVLVAAISHPIDPEVLQSLQITVNEQPVACRRPPGGGGRCLMIASLPVEVLRLDPDLTRIRFRWSRSVSKHEGDPGNVDERRLGPCFHQLLVGPRTASTGTALRRLIGSE